MDEHTTGIKRATMFGLNAEVERLRAENARLREALRSIAKNICCDRCQEAARVAQNALLVPGVGARG